MSRVVVTTPLPPGSLDPLHEAGHEVEVLASPAALSSAVTGADALVTLLTDTVDREVLAAGAGRLSVVANVAAGYDNIDVAAAAALGIPVCATPGILDESTAELAFALALMARRRTTAAEATLRAGRWDGWAIDGFLGHDLLGATMGIVGWGRIGRAVGRRASAFGMDVVHTAGHPTGVPGFLADVDDLFRTADVVSLHVPLTPSTRGLVTAERLRLMKPTAVLVNTARGAVVDEAALAEALHDGVIFGAGLDVYADEPTVHPRLLDAPGAVLLPHVGSATVRTRWAMARTAATAVVDVLAGRPSPSIVPPPSTPETP
jgi:glyoxylate reductase